MKSTQIRTNILMKIRIYDASAYFCTVLYCTLSYLLFRNMYSYERDEYDDLQRIRTCIYIYIYIYIYEPDKHENG